MRSSTTPRIQAPSQIIAYNSRHSVLICLECQYAVQKSALASHLLRHKIYRQERAILLSSLAHLHLLEPDDVPLPQPSEQPIVGLKVLEGLKCAVQGCTRLFESEKRMMKHWGEVHGGVGKEGHEVMRVIKMQTFFRGTKIRYFEVDAEPDDGDANREKTNSLPSLHGARTDGQGYSGHDANSAMSAITLPPRRSSPLKFSSSSLDLDIDLQTLTYFHHFLAITSLILPNTTQTHYWQASFVPLALQHRWLMCGLLALSASHCAVSIEDSESRERHCRCMMQFKIGFDTGFDEIVQLPHALNADSLPSGAAGDIKKAGGTIRCFLRLAYWMLAYSKSNQDYILEVATEEFELQTFIATIHELANFGSDISLHPNDDSSSGGQQDNFARARRILDTHTKNCSNSSSSPHSERQGEVESDLSGKEAILHRLHALPYRMAAAFPNPDPGKAGEVLATLAAIASLVECCEMSFASEKGAGWQAMVGWLISVGAGETFGEMLRQGREEALVVVAHWVNILVRRAEKGDESEGGEVSACWLLIGVTKRCLEEIGGLLSTVWGEENGLEAG